MELKYRSKNRNIAENFPKYLKVKQHTSNETRTKEEVTRQMKQHFELNEHN